MVKFKVGDRVVLTDRARRTLYTAWKLFKHEPLTVGQVDHGGYLKFENDGRILKVFVSGIVA